ncbi:Rieske (2Fe-2S) protein [Halorarum halophilum]|uniref:Rieske (2Fe-2S) protein n=1 Tax=Halorarum halophilum TaxID=2743090 RepID=UPI001FE31EAA|nr:Rieske 2Fe-2S domain-containing protein [Halobaculum halophilum]
MTDETARIAALEDVPDDTTLLFTVSDADGEPKEVVLSRLSDGAVVAFRNYCQHWTDARLDGGEGALVRNGEVVCQKHGATFQLDSGYCDFGPCEGSILESVDVVVDEGAVYLDDAYSFEHLGGSGVASDGDSANRIDFTGS